MNAKLEPDSKAVKKGKNSSEVGVISTKIRKNNCATRHKKITLCAGSSPEDKERFSINRSGDGSDPADRRNTWLQPRRKHQSAPQRRQLQSAARRPPQRRQLQSVVRRLRRRQLQSAARKLLRKQLQSAAVRKQLLLQVQQSQSVAVVRRPLKKQHKFIVISPYREYAVGANSFYEEIFIECYLLSSQSES